MRLFDGKRPGAKQNSGTNFSEREEDPRIKDLCNKCCSPGNYEHGNEKCGLAINSHNFAFQLMRNLAASSFPPENMVISPFRWALGYLRNRTNRKFLPVRTGPNQGHLCRFWQNNLAMHNWCQQSSVIVIKLDFISNFDIEKVLLSLKITIFLLIDRLQLPS